MSHLLNINVGRVCHIASLKFVCGQMYDIVIILATTFVLELVTDTIYIVFNAASLHVWTFTI